VKQRTVEIAGAGLAGLALAVRLAQLGWHVTLHERNKDLRMFGAGIWIWESGLRTLELLGAFDAATARAKSIKEWRIADGKGNILMTRPMVPGDRMLLPPRADLYQALIDRALELGVVVRVSSVAVSVLPEGVLLMEDGEERKADLVIAADGAYSRLRESILATGWMDFGIEAGIRMLIDHKPGDPEDIVTEYWNGPLRLLYNPCTDGENYIFLSARVSDPRGRQIPVERAYWTEHFPSVSDMIARFAEAGRWDRLVNVRCRTWCSGHVAIVGDAAHAMPPNLGQAANTAFINAMALAEIVTALPDTDGIPQALQDWERRQRPITNHVQWWSYLYGFVVAQWPARLMTLRSDFVRFIGKTEWFDESLNKGARYVPAGWRPGLSRDVIAAPPV
jgi:2-polyprenyl-6-methoxyphenol hydroxylase-like FAD-dependent oxidoreductase